jgi:hypothetical protein
MYMASSGTNHKKCNKSHAELSKIFNLFLSLFHKYLFYAPAWCQFMIGRTDLLRLTHGELTHVEHCGSSLIQGKNSKPS